MRSGRTTALALAAHLVVGVVHAAEQSNPGAIAVVVGANSQVREITLDTLRELYLRRRRVWADGSRVIPVNLPAESPVRETFSRYVLGRLPRDLVGYWNRRYFEGVQPPLVLKTPQAVCAYVAVEREAIGYVLAAEVDHGACRVLLVLPGAGG